MLKFALWKGDPMPYSAFADEATIADMARRWRVDYKIMARVARLCEAIPTRQVHSKQFFDRDTQEQLGAALETYVKYPKLRLTEERMHRAKAAHEKVSREVRLQDHIEKNLEEITALRAERSALMRDNDQLRAQLYALSDEDALLVLRLIPPCAQLCAMDEAAYTRFQADLVDDRNAVTVLHGALRLLGAALDASLRQNDARLLSPEDTMTVTRALVTLVDVGKIADARLDQYDALAQAILAQEHTQEVHP
jgi:hypothetical protein